MFVVVVYLLILAAAAFLTFAAFGDISSSIPPAEGSSAFFSLDKSNSNVTTGKKKKLFDADSIFVKKAAVPAQQQRLLSFLEDHCPAVPVRAASTTVLTHPSKFYEELKRQIAMAQESIFFSALYIGDGPLSKSFVGAIEAKVDEVVARHEKQLAEQAPGVAMTAVVKPFEVGILLDYNRMHDRKNLVTVHKLLATSHAMEYKYNHQAKTIGDPGDGTEGTDGPRSPNMSGDASLASQSADVNRSPIKVRLYLYQGPCRWNRLFAPLGRAKEVLGVQHTKIFVFDETNIILTGANLSDDYFATRMDRYIVYERNQHLSFFFLELLKVLFAVSHPVVSFSEFVDHLGGSVSDLALEPRSPLRRIKRIIEERRKHEAGAATKDGAGQQNHHRDTNGAGNHSALSHELSEKMTAQMVFPFRSAGADGGGAPTDAARTVNGQHSHGSPTLHRTSGLVILPNALGFDPSSETAAYAAHTRQLCLAFAAKMTKHFYNLAYDLLSANEEVLFSSQTATSGNGFDSVVFPTFQFGRVGIFHDSFIVKGLLSLANSSDHVYLTSPYLNVYSDFLDVLIGKAKAESDVLKVRYPVAQSSDDGGSTKDDNDFLFDVITASVKTNGWNGHRGAAGYIPYFYLQLERAFYFLVKAYNCVSRVSIHEFTEKGLTFHAKGIYFSSTTEGGNDHDTSTNKDNISDKATDTERGATHLAAPYLVAYGSTNYGYRSVHKDVEAEGFFFTFDKAFRERSSVELSYLLRQSTAVKEEQFVGNEMGRFQPVISLMAQMGQDFL